MGPSTVVGMCGAKEVRGLINYNLKMRGFGFDMLKNKPQEESVYICNTAQIAELFEVTERSVQILAQDKIIPRAKRGQFDLFLTAKAYIRNLKDRLGGKIIEPEQDDLKGRKLKAETEEREAKAALRRLELEEELGKLFRREEIDRQWTSRLIEVKAAMLEMPKRVAFRFTDPDVRIHVEEEVYAYVVEMLDRYSRSGIVPDSPVGAGDYAKSAETASTDLGKSVGRQKQNHPRKGKSASRSVEDT